MKEEDKTIVATVGIDDSFQVFRLADGSLVNIRIMDTSGQDKFDSLTSSFYKNADCCLLVYDITSKESFEKIKTYYITKIKENCYKIIKVVLLGNKKDLEKNRKVPVEDGIKLAEENEFIFMESSCYSNHNVADAFTTLIEMTNSELIKIKREKNNISLEVKTPKTIEKNERESHSSKCC